MAIDQDRETLVRISDLPAHIPGPVGAKKVNISTVHRWVQAGLRGARLETTAIGGRTYTSIEAFRRFNDAVNRAKGNAVPQRVSAAAEHAARRCEAIGI